MKVTLEFNGLEEQEEYNDAMNGWKYKAIITDIKDMVRSKIKYENKNEINLEELRTYIFDKINEYNVFLG